MPLFPGGKRVHGDQFGVAPRGRGRDAARAGVNLTHASLLDQRTDVRGIDSSADHQRDAIGGQLAEAAHDWYRVFYFLCTARREHAIEAEGDDVFERLREIARHVEGAMEGCFHRASKSEKFRVAPPVDRPIFIEDAEDDAIGAQGLGSRDIVLHGSEFAIGVDEVAPARTDHNEEIDGDEVADSGNHARAGRESVFVERSAEFDALGALAGRDLGRFDAVDADFERDGSGHLNLMIVAQPRAC